MKKVLIAMVVFFLYTSLYAQEENTYYPGLWGYTYDIGLPVGDTKEFIDNVSFRGFTVKGSKFINPNLSVGGSIGWHVFNEKKDDVSEPLDFIIEFDDGSEKDVVGSITGDQYRYINSFPFMVNLNYFLKNPSRNDISFYGGLGLGAMAIKKRVEVAVLSVDDTNWHFGLVPEIGLVKRFNSVYYLNTGVKYNHAFNAGGNGHSYLNFMVGILSEF
jgi:hypothetical protein